MNSISKIKKLMLSVLVAAMVIFQGCSGQNSIEKRVSSRDYPSVFQAWNPIDCPDYPLYTLEQRLRAAANHDLLWEEPVSQLGYGVELVLGAVWDGEYGGLATEFTTKSKKQALINRRKLLEMNPNMIFLMEVRWRDAPGSFLPEDSEYWQRNKDGSRVLGWDGGPEPYYMLDYENGAFQRNIARQSKISIESGIYDGVMLDWSGNIDVVKAVRKAIGNSGLIIVNIHDDIEDGVKYKDYINGAFMELNPVDDSPNPWDNRRDWDRIREALLYFEENFLPPVVNCLEVWGEREDLPRMRATTTLALTHSNGYVLYADPNPYPTPDHLHDWYKFWDSNLGKPVSLVNKRTDNAYEREFSNGIVVYNPYKNSTVKVVFEDIRLQVSTGSKATKFEINGCDGDIFLFIK